MDPIKLSVDLRARIIRRLTERVNEARAACGWPLLNELEPAEPTSLCGCVLAENLSGYALVSEVRIASEKDALAIAQAWGTEFRAWSTEKGGYLVRLPEDVKLGAAAFDAGLLPELIDPEAPWVDEEDGDDEVAKQVIEADCAMGMFRYTNDDITQEVSA